MTKTMPREGKGKRKATSPARSERFERRVRIQHLRSLDHELPESPTQAHPASASREHRDDDSAGSAAGTQSTLPSVAALSCASPHHRPIPWTWTGCELPDSTVHLWLDVFAKFPARSPTFVGAAQDFVQHSLSTPAALPGVGVIQRAIDHLHRGGVPMPKIDEVRNQLVKAWLIQTTALLIRVLPADLSTIGKALMTLPTGEGNVRVEQQGSGADGSPIATSGPRRSLPYVGMSETSIERPNPMVAPSLVETADQVETRPEATALEEVHLDLSDLHAESKPRRAALFKQRFPEPVDCFIYHVERAQLARSGERRCDRQGSNALHRQSRRVWDGLTGEQRRQWLTIHKDLLDGESHYLREEVAEVMLEEHGVTGKVELRTPSTVPSLDQMHKPEPSTQKPTTVYDASNAPTHSNMAPVDCYVGKDRGFLAGCSDPPTPSTSLRKIKHVSKVPSFIPAPRSPRVGTENAGSQQAVIVPFVSTPRNATRVMFIVNTPDLPTQAFPITQLRSACLATFGNRGGFASIHQCNNHVVVVNFKEAASAQQAIGAQIYLRGVQLTAEFMHFRPPKHFICDLTGSRVETAAVGLSVSRAFTAHQPGLTLHELHSPKLYPGRFFALRFDKSPQAFRFYIPIQHSCPGHVLTALFAINYSLPCALCRYQHSVGHLCESAKVVPLTRTE